MKIGWIFSPIYWALQIGRQCLCHYANWRYRHNLKNGSRIVGGFTRMWGKWKCEGHVDIMNGCHIDGRGGLHIGHHTVISRYVTILTQNHFYDGYYLPFDPEESHNNNRPVHIGPFVWIGQGVTILPGTNIKAGAIIGAGAVVHGTVNERQIIGAASPNEISYRDKGHYTVLALCYRNAWSKYPYQRTPYWPNQGHLQPDPRLDGSIQQCDTGPDSD